jgi:hypothetical protein
MPEQLSTVGYSAAGVLVTFLRYRTVAAARRSMHPAQRKLYNAAVFELPGGGFDIFPLGHPVPAGAVRV